MKSVLMRAAFFASVCASAMVAVAPFTSPAQSQSSDLTATAAQGTDEEYRVKADFLFHFAQLIDWPPDPHSSGDHSLVLCTFGADPFQGALESTVAGKSIGDRIIQVRHLERPQAMQSCHILFLGRAENREIPLLLADLHNAPVLTVGETGGFLAEGGMICFLLQDNRVRFAINLDAAEAAHLRIGSRLLILAQNVVGIHQEK